MKGGREMSGRYDWIITAPLSCWDVIFLVPHHFHGNHLFVSLQIITVMMIDAICFFLGALVKSIIRIDLLNKHPMTSFSFMTSVYSGLYFSGYKSSEIIVQTLIAILCLLSIKNPRSKIN